MLLWRRGPPWTWPLFLVRLGRAGFLHGQRPTEGYQVLCMCVFYVRIRALFSHYISPTPPSFLCPPSPTPPLASVLLPEREQEEGGEEGRRTGARIGVIMGSGEGICDGGLVLRLGYEGWTSTGPCVKLEHYSSPPCSTPPTAPIEPSLTLSLPEVTAPLRAPGEVDAGGGEEPRLQARQSSPHSAVSSFSGAYPASSGAKREKDVVSEEVEAERGVSGRASDDDEEGSARKKLRLTKEQSALLEDMFKEHSTLNPKQKQALARQLNLRPRQVEVWFQNRRARTKLKQTEMDCELLRRCCESLTDENQRLQKELQELKALKFASPLYMQLRPAATLTMCPSCERTAAGAATAGDMAKGGAAGTPFVTATKTHFYNPFATAHPPPAAC